VYDLGHATRPSELDAATWQQFCGDLWVSERAISRALQPDHINVECLGNTVPHLHVAIVPRYRSDARWGNAIWMTSRGDMPQLRMNDDEYETIAQALRGNIASAA
jgi:diadenosine tetraphosphate (Ap4A) HIT family hydrolase